MAAKRKSRKPARAKASVAQSRLPEAVHQISLAGLGAVARAQSGAPKLLDELISEGSELNVRMRGTATEAVRGLVENVQENVSAGVSAARGQAVDAMDKLEKMFRARVRRALTQLGVPSSQEIEALSKRVDTLNDHLGKLTTPRRTAARRRTSSRRSGAKSPPPSMHAP